MEEKYLKEVESYLEKKDILNRVNLNNVSTNVIKTKVGNTTYLIVYNKLFTSQTNILSDINSSIENIDIYEIDTDENNGIYFYTLYTKKDKSERIIVLLPSNLTSIVRPRLNRIKNNTLDKETKQRSSDTPSKASGTIVTTPTDTKESKDRNVTKENKDKEEEEADNKYPKNIRDQIIYAIKNKLLINFDYINIWEGGSKIERYRKVAPAALGYSKFTGRLLLRALQFEGGSFSKSTPYWRLFALSNMFPFSTTRQNNTVIVFPEQRFKILNGYKKNDSFLNGIIAQLEKDKKSEFDLFFEENFFTEIDLQSDINNLEYIDFNKFK
jgi:hypothetical protein